MLITLFTLPTEILQNNKNHSIPPPRQCRGGGVLLDYDAISGGRGAPFPAGVYCGMREKPVGGASVPRWRGVLLGKYG